MLHIDSFKIAVSLLNSTLGLDDLPMEVHGRLATVLILIDRQDGEDFNAALRDAYGYLDKDTSELDKLLEGLEVSHD